MRVKYIGKKPQKYDNVCYTRTVWAPDEVHEVDEAVAARLIRYPTVWVNADDEPIPSEGVTLKPEASVKEILGNLGSLSDEQLAELSEAEKGRDKPRATLVKAVEAELEKRATAALGE